MATSTVFAGYEDNILIVKNDESEYYVPSFNVETLTEMCPGEAYAIFLSGSDAIDFTYPEGMARESHDFTDIENFKACTERYDVAVTGESHLIVLDEISGKVKEGDILRAYSNDKLVGSINICDYHLEEGYPVSLAAHKSLDFSQYGGPELDGYVLGNKIDIRLFSQTEKVELAVIDNLDFGYYERDKDNKFSPLSHSFRAFVSDDLATPTVFKLAQNYPNPFNPTTTIEYNVESSGFVTLNVYDVVGRLVRTLVNNQYIVAGNTSGYKVMWNGLDNRGNQVSAGLYIYRLQSGTMATVNKMILLK